MSSIDEAEVPGILKQAFKDNEVATRKDERNKVLDKLIEVFATRYCTSQDIEHGDIPRVALDELAEVIEHLRKQEQPK